MALTQTIPRILLPGCLVLALGPALSAQIFAPDLRADSLTGSTYDWVAGKNVSFEAKYTNLILLFGDAGAHRVGWYLSADSTITTKDVLITSYKATSLKSGYQRTLRGTMRVPDSSIANGTRYWGMFCDDQGQLKEPNEGNNIYRRAVTYRSGRDLTVMGYSVPTTLQCTSTVKIGALVGNQGHLTATGFYTGFFLSSNSTISHSDHYLGSIYTSSLSANANTGWKYINVRIPSLPSFGTYWVGIEADCTYRVTEKIESNNVRVTTRNVTAPPSNVRALEYRHMLQTSTKPYYMSRSQFQAIGYASVGGSVDMRVTAPSLASGLQICVWSAKSPWTYDYTSDFCLGLMNNPALFPGWFSVLDSKGQAGPRFYLPKNAPIKGSFVVYTQSFLFNKYFRFSGTTGVVKTTLIQ